MSRVALPLVVRISSVSSTEERGLKLNPVALGGQFQGGLSLFGQELYFDVFDTRKRFDQHHIHLRQLSGILANKLVF